MNDQLRYRIFSKTHPQSAVLKKPSLLSADILRCVDAIGSWRGPCPCCDKRIIVRLGADGTALSDSEAHYLLVGGD